MNESSLCQFDSKVVVDVEKDIADDGNENYIDDEGKGDVNDNDLQRWLHDESANDYWNVW